MGDRPGHAILRAVLTSAEPQIFVASVQDAADFYNSEPGFTVAFVYGTPPSYGQVVRDATKLNLRMVSEPVFAGDARKREGLLSASITVATSSDLAQLFMEFRGAGVSFHQELKSEPWGARTFVVSDPDGNLILFAGLAE